MSLSKILAAAHAAHRDDTEAAIDAVLDGISKMPTKTEVVARDELIREGIKSRLQSLRSSDKRFVKQNGTTTKSFIRTGPGGWKKKVTKTQRRSRNQDAISHIQETLFDSWFFKRANKALGDMTVMDWDVEIQSDSLERNGLDKNIQFATTIRDGCVGRKKTRNCWKLEEVEAHRDRIFGEEAA